MKARGRGERFFDKSRFASEVSYSNVRRDTYQGVSFLNRDANLDPISETIEATTSDTFLVTRRVRNACFVLPSTDKPPGLLVQQSAHSNPANS